MSDQIVAAWQCMQWLTKVLGIVSSVVDNIGSPKPAYYTSNKGGRTDQVTNQRYFINNSNCIHNKV